MRRSKAEDKHALPGGVVFFDPYSEVIGGAQRVTLAVASELDRRGVSVRVVTTSDGALVRSAEAAGLPHRVVKMPRRLDTFGHATVGTARFAAAAALPVAWWRLVRVLRPRPSVVHVTDLRGLILAGPPARALGIPVVWHLHATEPEPLLNSLAGLFAKVSLVPSHNAVSTLPGPVRRRSRVLHNGVPDAAFDAPAVRFSQPLVVAAGRISAEKGIDVLLKAMPDLLRTVPQARVRVFGGVQPGWEDYHAHLVEQIRERGLGDRFDLAGFVDRPCDEWTDASVFVQPSRREAGTSLAVVEAMASGLPVVASEVGGLPELVEDGVTGLLVPPENPEALAKALADLLGDPARARRIGEAGQQRVRRLHSMSTMVDSLMDLYLEIR